MTWHVICRVGPDDLYTPKLSPADPRIIVSFEAPHDEHAMRYRIGKPLRRVLRRRPDAQIVDLLLLAMAVFAADHCIKRETTDDGWTRDVLLHLPVKKKAKWNAASDTVIRMLRFLSGDAWDLDLRMRKFSPEFPASKKKLIGKPKAVCLFSGGLDSLVGAIDLLEANVDVSLVGHYGSGTTHKFQENLLQRLTAHYESHVHPVLFYVDPPFIEKMDRETTKRSRSLLFFSLGLLAANAVAPSTQLCVAENGLISLNVPLTNSRSGSLATRTTHPHFIELLRQALSMLGVRHELQLPYRHKTKGEMLKESQNRRLLRKLTPLSMSCAHPEVVRWHKRSPGCHCGYCIPCIIRRAAIKKAKFRDADYAIDVLTDPPKPTKKRGYDLRATQMAVERFSLTRRSHDIADVMSSGPVPPHETKEYVGVYQRGMKELANFLKPRASKKNSA